MPEMPKRPCAGGCGRLVEAGKCAICVARAGGGADGRGSSTQRLYGARWRRERGLFLALNPFCTDPYKLHNGIWISATDLDHIIAHKGDLKLFWDKTNWQSLCKRCHSRKTASEGGFGNSTRWGH